jgi:hypothetical protein
MAINKKQTTLKGSKKTEEVSGKKASLSSKKKILPKSSGTVRSSDSAKNIRTGFSGETAKAGKKKETAEKTGRKMAAKTPVAPKRAKKKSITEKHSGLRIYLPQEEYSAGPLKTSFPELPEEYGENELILMEVDPSIVFVSWEVKPDEISKRAGRLNLRIYDVTGMDVDSSQHGSRFRSFFDIPVRNRVDSKFYELKMSGKAVFMEIGLLHKRKFTPITRSNRVSIPELYEFEKSGKKRPNDTDKLFGY